MTRYTRAWIVAILLAGVSFWLLFVIEPGPDNSRSMQQFWDLGHLFLFFAVFASIFQLGFVQSLSTYRQFLLVCIFALLVGGGVELIQRGLQRQADWHDLWLDLAGGLLAFIVFSQFWKAYFWRKLVFAIGLLFIACWPVMTMLLDEYYVERDFPLLSDLEQPDELSRWISQQRISIDQTVKRSGCCALKLQMQKGKYASAKLHYIKPDWQSYRELRVDVYNPDPVSREMWISVDDDFYGAGRYVWPGLFVQRYLLSPGWNQLALVYERKLKQVQRKEFERGQIRAVIFYVEKPYAGQTLYFDNIRLKQ